MGTAMRTRWQATADRWTAAVERGEREGVQVRLLGCGAWNAASGTDRGGAYVVTFHDCECRAALEGDPVCKHRAMLRVRVGVCPVCGGAGVDPACAGHAVAGGVVACGCPGCGAPDLARPRPVRAETGAATPATLGA